MAAELPTVERLEECTRRLALELGEQLSLGYIGNCSPGPGYDDRWWSVEFPGRRTWRGAIGRGLWSHRADGYSIPRTRCWATAEAPSPVALEVMIRGRLEQLVTDSYPEARSR